MTKKITAALLSALLALGAASCGDIDDSAPKRPSLKRSFESSSADESSDTAPAAESSLSDNSAEDESSADDSAPSLDETDTHTATKTVGLNGAKAVSEVSIYSSKCDDIENKVSITDMYGRHALHSAVVGLVGAPVEFDFDKNDIPSALIMFTVEKNELRGVRPDALMFMWYDERNDNYVELERETEIDETKSSVICSVSVKEPGTYLLVNKYTWYNVWGAGLADNGLEKGYVPGLSDIAPSDAWELEEDTGDILTLLDVDYLMSSLKDGGAEFKVSTPEQLAAACYFVNCCNLDKYSERSIQIYLEADIDLSGIKWSPMGWDMAGVDHRFAGYFFGNGHKISNLTVDGRYYNSGFIGESCGCGVFELTIENADISGISSVGVLIGQDVRSHISDVTVSGSVNGGSAGPIVGEEAGVSLYYCSADVTVNGGDDLNGELTYTRYIVKKLADEFGYPEKVSVVGDKVVRPSGIEAKYNNMQWHFCVNGNSVFEGSSAEELEIKTLLNKVNDLSRDNKYTVALYAFESGYYIPVSNEIELDITPYL